jgi:hypothetical protein
MTQRRKSVSRKTLPTLPARTLDATKGTPGKVLVIAVRGDISARWSCSPESWHWTCCGQAPFIQIMLRSVPRAETCPKRRMARCAHLSKQLLNPWNVHSDSAPFMRGDRPGLVAAMKHSGGASSLSVEHCDRTPPVIDADALNATTPAASSPLHREAISSRF